MGSYRRHVGALVRRNLLYRKRAWFGAIIQLLMPSLMILILVSIKFLLKDNDTFKPQTIPEFFPSTALKPFSFLDYVNGAIETRKCVDVPRSMKGRRYLLFRDYIISGIDPDDWANPFLKCDLKRCKSLTDDVSKHCSVNVLALAGDKTRVASFESYIKNTYPQINSFTKYSMIKTFDTSEEIDDYVKDDQYGNVDVGRPKIALAVILSGSGKEYEYTIRANSTNFNSPENDGRPAMATHPNTKVNFETFAKEAGKVCEPMGGTAKQGPYEDSCTGQYMYNGVLSIQRLVDDFILADSGAKAAGTFVAENGVSFADFPSSSYTQDGFYAQVAPYAPLLLVLGLLYPVAAIIRFIVSEKELRQKELMKMMSVSESALELSWLITSYGFFFLSGILSTIVSSRLYPKASIPLLLIFWELGYLAVTLFSMSVAAVFSKTTRATLVGILVFFAGYFLTLSAPYDTGSRVIMSLVSLHPVAAMAYAIQIIGNLEDADVGLKATTISFSDVPSGFSFGSALVSLFFCVFYWGYNMWYLNRVVPGEYGQSLPLYFPFTRSYWFGGEMTEDNLEDWSANPKYESVPVESVGATLKEQERQGMGVHIRGLTKEFGDKRAVDELDLSMYTGEVFALLGHNGAGKTTTISMLTGLLAPTSGYAVINGKNIRTQMKEIREDCGICLQHDCLFPTLTVLEHLRFFARVKGLYETSDHQEAETSIEESVKDVALFEKRNTQSKDLSGGMKRKLSLAIAFCGGSKVVFLDEPTSGQDPFSRRFTWNVIRQNRQDRCIVLTTHFMDEADLLGDRIAIMAEGHLCCVGSSLFLKREFGVGYQITVEKAKNTEETTEKVKDIVKSNIPETSILSNVSSEITFQLPIDAASSFATMFKELDVMVSGKEINMYGVGITTLDEVFLMVARGGESRRTSVRPSEAIQSAVADNCEGEIQNSSYLSREDATNVEYFSRHVRSLFAKRALNFKRDKKAWACSTILPVLFSLFGFLNVTLISPDRNMPMLELRLKDYNSEVPDDGKKYPLPTNIADSFPCQPATCVSQGSEGTYSNFCGNLVNLGGENLMCSDTSVDGFSNELKSSGYFPLDLNVSSIQESSKALSKNPEIFKLEASQYGALFFTHSADSTVELDTGRQHYNESVRSKCENATYLDGFDCLNFGGTGYLVSTNFTSLHAPLLYQGTADQTLMRNTLDDEDYTIKVNLHPLPITKVENSFAQAENSFSAWFYLILSFPFISGTFATFIVQERMSKAKHLQTVAGVKPSAYWLSTLMWDMMNYQFPLWIVVAMMYAFGVDAFTASERGVAAGTIVLLFVFGPASAGFTYIITFLFKSPSACNMFVIVFNFFIALAGSMAVLILRFIHIATVANGGKSDLKLIAQIIEWILRFIPSFNFAKGLLFIINIDAFAIVYSPEIDVWDVDIVGYEVMFLAIQCVLYPVIALYLDILSTKPSVGRLFGRRIALAETSDDVDDEDVLTEAERVRGGNANSDTIVLSELRKKYPNGKVAVDGLSFGIPGGQCFGLLGINGAGKTTTMSMLTAEFPPTSGDATLAGFSVTNKPEETRRRIGYCPQFDAHFMNMTGKEHVQLYADIKGVPSEYVAEAVASKLNEVGLNEEDSDRLSSNYSGGMKRKLSVACATIGSPEIVFLDEPSTGMDPVSRRDLWGVISRMVLNENGTGRRTSVILTTHSMEECEALCPKIGIMAGGKLKCIGSAQHLKSRFGQGYQVELKVDEPKESDPDLVATISELLRTSNKTVQGDVEDGANANVDEVFFSLGEALEGAKGLAGNSEISDKITEDDPVGYLIFKNASSDMGVSLGELAAFCATEMRLRELSSFFETNYPASILRERQDTRMRFEVPSEGTQIASLFGTIEENKVDLNLQDYGISQTTLEQVFNMHAANAEKKKQGTDDR